ncbi:MAG: AraC family transcriptional regulator [Pseudomonadota bacterium]
MPLKKELMLYQNAPFVEERVYQTIPDWHVHDFCQVLFGLQGQSELEIQGNLYRTYSMRGVIVPRGSRHDFVGNKENCQLVVDLPLSSIAIPHALLDKPREFAVPANVDNIIYQVNTLAFSKQRQYDWLLAVHLVDQIILSLGGNANDAARFPVKQIECYLRTHINRAVTTTELATHFGWKQRRFHDLFYHAFGDTPQHYHIRLRLDYALKLLSDPSNKLIEIADSLGYSDQQAFTHSFSARFGMAPGQWRAHLKTPIKS